LRLLLVCSIFNTIVTGVTIFLFKWNALRLFRKPADWIQPSPQREIFNKE